MDGFEEAFLLVVEHRDRTTEGRMEINARLEKLERENRWMKKIGIVATVVLSTLIIGGQAKTNKVVEANEFRLVDASRKVRA